MKAALVALIAAAGCSDGSPQQADADACPSDEPSPDVLCTSGILWTQGNQPSTRMRPGLACIECHVATPGAPVFSIAGTVFPTAHEPDDCLGASGATVRIVDANGTRLELSAGTTGNFFASAGAVIFPIRAEVEYAGVVRAMCEARTTGDCNECHTQFGANGAPGRVRLP